MIPEILINSFLSNSFPQKDLIPTQIFLLHIVKRCIAYSIKQTKDNQTTQIGNMPYRLSLKCCQQLIAVITKSEAVD